MGFFLLLLASVSYSSVAAADGALRITISDENDRAVPCRIHLKDEAGKPVRAPGLPFWRDHFVCNGDVALTLPAGNYSLEIERGPEYKPITAAIELPASTRKTVFQRLARISNLAALGWHSGELHVHRPVEDIPLLMQAEDLEVAPVITWWNNRNLWANRELPAETLTQFDGRRYFDVMAGEDEREGGALLFFHLRKPLAISGVSREYPSPLKFVAEARESGRAWIDVEKPFWWDVPTWVAAGAADSFGIANNHMCHSSMYENEAWGRPRDAKRLPPPRGDGYWSQEIYYHLLNCGLRIPPSAGSASGVLPNPVGYNRVYVHTGESFDYATWWDGLKAGRSFVTNGPLLITRADGHFPGHVFKAAAGKSLKIPLEAWLTANDHVPAFEVIQNGKVLLTVPVHNKSKAVPRATDAPHRAADPETSFEGKIGELTFDASGWFLIRAITDNPRTFRFASTAPYYVEIGDDTNPVRRKSAQFFLDWTNERIARVPMKLNDPQQLEDVLAYHKQAREFWEKKVAAGKPE